MTSSLNQIKFFVIDADGVIWRGGTLLPGAKEFFAFLRRRGIPFSIATNNSSKTQIQYAQKLADLGIEITPDEVMTSSLATAEYLKTQCEVGSKIYVIGHDGIRQAVAEAGFIIAGEDARAVVVGIDFGLSYDKLKTAVILINNGAKFIGTNPDLTFPIEGAIAPGAGAIQAAITAATGQQPIIMGKPEAAIFQFALKRMQADPAHTAMIGDRLETDILGAQRAGLKSILVLSGVTSVERLAASDIEPDWVFSGINELVKKWNTDKE